MSDLFAILSQGGSSLAAHRAATATASHNLQNANTPGYSRQRVELGAMLPPDDIGAGQIGRGVSVMSVTQARDRFLENQLPTALGDQARSSAEADTLEAVSALDPDTANGITAALGRFYGSLRNLSQNPGDRGLRQAVITQGQSMTLAFNQAAHAIDTARTGVDAKLEDVVGDANRAATAIADLNRQIRGSVTPPNDLLDARQKHMDNLARLTGARAVDNGNRTVSMMLPGGTALVSEFHAATLGLRPNVNNGGHADVTVTQEGSSLTTALPAGQFSGNLAGLLDARDVGLGNTRTSLDNLAFEFSNAFNTIHSAGFGLDGVNGRAFFTPLGAAADAAGQISVDAAVAGDPGAVAASTTAAGVPGGGDNVLALVASEDLPIINGADVGESLGRLVANYGSIASQARARFEQDSYALESLDSLREATSGVSIDEELVSLTKSQRAFEAVMKVIQTGDEMLSTLMNLR